MRPPERDYRNGTMSFIALAFWNLSSGLQNVVVCANAIKSN